VNVVLSNQVFKYLGTLRANRVEVPRELANPAGRERFSSEFAFHNDTTFVSYKSHLNRCVLLLSSQHHDVMVHNERADSKPEIILEYNRKGAFYPQRWGGLRRSASR